MRSDDLDRVKHDLATLKLAISPGLPFRPQTVRFAFAVAAGGALALLWTLQPYSRELPWDAVVPWVLSCLPLAATLLHFILTCRPEQIQVSPADIRRAHMHYAPYVMALLSIPFLLVARGGGWVSHAFLVPAFLFMFAASVTSVALTEPRQQYLLGLSIPMLGGAIAALICGVPPAIVYGLAMLVGGVASALWMKLQLRRQESARAAD